MKQTIQTSAYYKDICRITAILATCKEVILHAHIALHVTCCSCVRLISMTEPVKNTKLVKQYVQKERVSKQATCLTRIQTVPPLNLAIGYTD